MIARLTGRVEDISGRTVLLDVNGVGYEVICSSSCLASLTLQDEKRVTVYTDVKEESIRLYGFSGKEEKQVFLLLLQVKGVGAKSGLDIISSIETRDLLKSISSEDVAGLSKIKGIGKKTAERIIVELRDKVTNFATERQYTVSKSITKEQSAFEDAIEALQALGINRRIAENAVASVKDTNSHVVDAGALVKLALQYI